MPLHCKLGTFGSFLLGVYSYIGLVIILFGHGLWYESLREIGVLPHYRFTIEEGGIWSIYLLPSLVLIFVLTSGFKRHKLIAKLFEKKIFSLEAYSLMAAFVNVTVIFVSYVFLLFFIPSLFHPFKVCFVFVNAGIVGVSTLYYIAPPAWKAWKSKNRVQEIEALKLEHDYIWKAVNIISWTAVIMAVSAIFVSWTQIILPSIPAEKRYTFSVIKLQAYSAIELIYLILGLWFGILGRLMEYSWRIRKRIAEIS